MLTNALEKFKETVFAGSLDITRVDSIAIEIEHEYASWSLILIKLTAENQFNGSIPFIIMDVEVLFFTVTAVFAVGALSSE